MERFDAYVDRCLYDPVAGFYATTGNAGGRSGDFITSPEVGPLFGEVLATALDQWWTELGSPDEFIVVEAAAGRGALAAAILRAAPACLGALRYITVERSARLRDAQRELLGDSIESCAELTDVTDGEAFVGVVLANELLDNLAFRLVVRGDAEWAEVFVDDGVPVVGPLNEIDQVRLERIAPGARVGTRLPLHDQAATWVSNALGRIAAGRLVIIDYGVATTAELVGRDWLRTYRGHQRGADPFELAGSCDITCDVAFDQLPPGATLTTQAAALSGWGLDELVADGRRVWHERSHLGDLAAMKARSRVNEAEALTDPSGLGSFWVAEWVVRPVEPTPKT